MIFLHRTINNKLSSEAPTYIHPGFCSASHRPTFAIFVTENAAPTTAKDSITEEAARKISNNTADSHNTRRGGFKNHDNTDTDADTTKTPTSKGLQQG
jgi:hypothetical protein